MSPDLFRQFKRSRRGFKEHQQNKMDIFTKIRIAAALAKIALGGKASKTLEKIEGGIEIAEQVRKILPKKKKS